MSRKFSEDDLLEVARKVLTGTLRRSDLATLERPQLAYVGIATMLASGYRLLSGNRVDGGLNDVLDDLVLKGIPFKRSTGRRSADRDAHWPNEVVKAASDLKLYKPGARDG